MSAQHLRLHLLQAQYCIWQLKSLLHLGCLVWLQAVQCLLLPQFVVD